MSNIVLVREAVSKTRNKEVSTSVMKAKNFNHTCYLSLLLDLPLHNEHSQSVRKQNDKKLFIVWYMPFNHKQFSQTNTTGSKIHCIKIVHWLSYTERSPHLSLHPKCILVAHCINNNSGIIFDLQTSLISWKFVNYLQSFWSLLTAN